MAHPLSVLAHPIILARSTDELRDEYEERAAIRTFLGNVDTWEGEHGAAREVFAKYLDRNKEWLPPCS
jgi:hypothetical protein